MPVINGGDGPNQHPTQSLADLYTLKTEKGRLGNLHIGIAGDLKYGRTVHSLISMLSLYEGCRFTLISHPDLRLDEKYKKANMTETDSLAAALPKLDALYVTRVQQERFSSAEEYTKVKDAFSLTPEMLKDAPEDMIVMHPLPRTDEISSEVDALPQARYFEQAARGVFARMALLSLMKPQGPITAA